MPDNDQSTKLNTIRELQGIKLTKIEKEVRHLSLLSGRYAEMTNAANQALGDKEMAVLMTNRMLASQLQVVYTGMKSVIRNVIEDIDGFVPTADSWHVKLLEQAAQPLDSSGRPALLKDRTRKHLDEMRKFRHMARNSYGVGLQLDRLIELSTVASEAFSWFKHDFNVFFNTLINAAAPTATAPPATAPAKPKP